MDWFITSTDCANGKSLLVWFGFNFFFVFVLFRCDFGFLDSTLCGNSFLIYRIYAEIAPTAMIHAWQWVTRNWIESMVSYISIVRIVQANGSSVVDIRAIHIFHPFPYCERSRFDIILKRRARERRSESAHYRTQKCMNDFMRSNC